MYVICNVNYAVFNWFSLQPLLSLLQAHVSGNGIMSMYAKKTRDAPITHWPIIGRPIGAKQSADYRLIQEVPETGQKPAVHTII